MANRNRKGFYIHGVIQELESGRGMPGLIVEALDKDLVRDDRLGSAITDEKGRFELHYEKEDFQETFFAQKPDIYLCVAKADGTVIHTTESKVCYGARRTRECIIKIPERHLGRHPSGRIRKVTVSPSVAKLGTKILVTANVQRNSHGSFTIVGVAASSGTPMVADPKKPAVYRGSYTVKAGDDILDATVIVRFIDPKGNTMVKEAKQKITIDTIPPRIENVVIRPFVVRNGTSMQIQATSEPEAELKVDISELDTTKKVIELAENPPRSGNFFANIKIDEENQAANGAKTIRLMGKDVAGNNANSVEASIELRNVYGILSIEVPQSEAKMGRSIRVKMTAEPNGKAVFSIKGVEGAEVVKMVESPGEPGIYIGSYTVRKGNDITEGIISVKFTDPSGSVISREAEQKVIIDTFSPFEKTLEGMEFSPGKVEALKEGGIETLSDVRRLGDVAKLELGGISKDEAQNLDRHARLAVTIPDVQLRDQLISSDVSTIAQVADLSTDELVELSGGSLSLETANGIKSHANAWHMFYQHKLTEISIAYTLANRGLSYYIVQDYAPDVSQWDNWFGPFFDQCSPCPECESALSPGAYVIDLIRFMGESFSMGLTECEDRFYQRFGELALDCNNVELLVRQIEIANEVLENFIVARRGWNWRHVSVDVRNQIYDDFKGLRGEKYDKEKGVYNSTGFYPDVLIYAFNLCLKGLGTDWKEIFDTSNSGTQGDLAERLGLTMADLDFFNIIVFLERDILVSDVEAFLKIEETNIPPAASPGLIQKAKTSRLDENAPNYEQLYNDAMKEVKTAVDSVKSQILPKIRANLIKLALDELSSNPIEDLEITDAKQLGDFLHIDLSVDACHRVTRLEQAIETVHSFVLAAQLGKEPVSMDDFDEKQWTWMKSYSTWHAAQMVFLYPENFLFPDVRRNQTPQFERLVEEMELEATPKSVVENISKYVDFMINMNITIKGVCAIDDILFIFGLRQVGYDRHMMYYSFFDKAGRWIGWKGLGQAEEEEGGKIWPASYNYVGMVPFNNKIYLFVTDRSNVLRYMTISKGSKGWTKAVPEGYFKSLEISNVLHNPILAVETFQGNKVGLIPTNDHIYIYCFPQRVSPLWRSWLYCYCMDNNEEVVYKTSLDLSEIPREIPENLVDLVGLGTRDKKHYLLLGTKPGYQSNGSLYLLAVDTESSGWSVFYDSICGISPDWPFYITVYTFGGMISGDRGMIWLEICKELAHGNGIIHYEMQLRTLNFPPEKLFPEYKSETFTDISLYVHMGKWNAVTHFNNEWLLFNTTCYRKIGGYECTAANSYFECVFAPILWEGSYKLVMDRPPELSWSWPLRDDFDEGAAAYFDEEIANFRIYHTIDPVSVYLKEFYVHIPLLAGESLNENRQFEAALKWYNRLYYPFGEWETEYCGLGGVVERELSYREKDEWLHDPFDPHAIAQTRRGVYLRHTLFKYVENLLDWADAQFVRDTAESINRARELYELAQDILETDNIPKNLCELGWRQLRIDIVKKYSQEQAQDLNNWIDIYSNIGTQPEATQAYQFIMTILKEDKPFEDTIGEIRQYAHGLQTEFPQPLKLSEQWEAQENVYSLLESEDVERAVTAYMTPAPMPPSYTPAPMPPSYTPAPWPPSYTPAPWPPSYTPAPWPPSLSTTPFSFCIPSNQNLNVLVWRIESNLQKIRTCRNFAGMPRSLQPYATPVDPEMAVKMAAEGIEDFESFIPSEPPPIYRYSFLLERAKYFISIAQQLEASMLTTIEKEEKEKYDLLRAEQDLSLAQANVTLQALRLKEASDAIGMAQLQRDKAEFQKMHFEVLLAAGLNCWEQESLRLMECAIAYQLDAANFSFIAAKLPASIGTTGATVSPQGSVQAEASGYSSVASAKLTNSNFAQAIAAYERRQQNWKFQRELSDWDIKIGDRAITLAKDQKDIVQRERDIAEMSTEFAGDVLNFLSSKFTNVELYRWMNKQLKKYYREHLNFAIATARAAQRALAFERQESLNFIAPMYWEAERRGLLGAEALLLDINKMDQHRVTTTVRKKELSKTISLAAMDPVEFQNLRETGVMHFDTLLEQFDRDFPGHYMRLIKNVSLTVIALVPPNQEIHTTLSNTGTSRVVVSPASAEPKVIYRQAESIAVTGSNQGTGLFELRLDDPMLLPFEGNGVETSWILEMPKGANNFDFDSLVEVFLTIRYTALEDRMHRNRVLDQMIEANGGWKKDDMYGVGVSGTRYFSFKSTFPDQWYHFLNPVFLEDQSGYGFEAGMTPPPYAVQFELTKGDFPPNESNPKMKRLNMLFVREDNQAPIEFTFKLPHGPLADVFKSIVNEINPLGQVRIDSSNPGFLIQPDNEFPSPLGKWELEVEHGQQKLDLSWVKDIILVVTYDAETSYVKG